MILESCTIGEYTLEIGNDISKFRAAWLLLQDCELATPYQGYEWVRTATETLDSRWQVRILLLRHGSTPCLVLPFVVEAAKPAIVRWPGDNHANIGQGLFSREFLENQPSGIIAHCMSALANTIDGPAVLHLKNQPGEIGGFPNPMLQLASQEGPNPLYAMDLSQGFDQLLAQANGKRKRRAFRNQLRACEKLGGFEFYSPANTEEIRETIALFFELKKRRLRELGVRDVFDPAQAKNMLLELALRGEENGWQPLRLYVLKVGGIVRGIYGVGIAGKRCCAQINAMRYDAFVSESPGEMMIYLMVRDLAEQGFEYFDLGIGVERYKKSWCKHELRFFETIFPLADNVTPFSTLKRLQTRIKTTVKSNEYVWSRIKRLRRIGADWRR